MVIILVIYLVWFFFYKNISFIGLGLIFMFVFYLIGDFDFYI